MPSNFAVKAVRAYRTQRRNRRSGKLATRRSCRGRLWTTLLLGSGVAWQPFGDRFVVRAGYGWFYDRIYGNLLIDNQLNLPPYSGAAAGPSPSKPGKHVAQPLRGRSHNPEPARVDAALHVTCSQPLRSGLPALCSSGFGYTSDSPSRWPIACRSYRNTTWTCSTSSRTGGSPISATSAAMASRLYNWSQDVNVARLVAGAPNSPRTPRTPEMVTAFIAFQRSCEHEPCHSEYDLQRERARGLSRFCAGRRRDNRHKRGLTLQQLAAQLRHQFSRGLLLQAAYTWSKAFTNVDTTEAGSGINPPGEMIYGSSNSNDSLDLHSNTGWRRSIVRSASWFHTATTSRGKDESGFAGKSAQRVDHLGRDDNSGRSAIHNHRQ